MSAYVVDDSTINNIVSILSRKANNSNHFATYGALAKLGYNLGQPKDDKRLADDLFNLNVQSVCERYDDDKPENYDFSFGYVPGLFDVPPTIQAIKSISCWMYQSCEGSCYDHPLYKAMEKLRGDLSYEIVSDMEVYSMAEWE